MLHVICTRLCPGLLSTRARDGSRRSEETVKNLELRLGLVVVGGGGGGAAAAAAAAAAAVVVILVLCISLSSHLKHGKKKTLKSLTKDSVCPLFLAGVCRNGEFSVVGVVQNVHKLAQPPCSLTL